MSSTPPVRSKKQTARNVASTGAKVAGALIAAAIILPVLLVLGFIAVLGILDSQPDQKPDQVIKHMQATLDAVDYKTLPGYKYQQYEINPLSNDPTIGPTTYDGATTSLRYYNAAALMEARHRLEAKGWTCYASKTAPVVQKQALEATGSTKPNSSCQKRGFEVLNFTYVSPTDMRLESETGKDVVKTGPTDRDWCAYYGSIMELDAYDPCQRTLGHDLAPSKDPEDDCPNRVYDHQFSEPGETIAPEDRFKTHCVGRF